MTSPEFDRFSELEKEFGALFSELSKLQISIHSKLAQHADGKKLKGNEIVGWLGEIYCKYIFDGELVDDSFEHDVETSDGMRISVKTRKGNSKGWNRTSAIPKVVGNDAPTHLLFVRLNNEYIADRMWLFLWQVLIENNRFKDHMVRGQWRSYYVNINEKTDQPYLIYSR